MARRTMWMLGAAAALLASAQEAESPVESGLYFFFTPDAPGLSELSRALRETPVPLRRILLVDDFRRWPPPFLSALGDLGELAMADEEGLALARRLDVRRVPCLVRVHDGRIHKATGSRLDWKELLECRP